MKILKRTKNTLIYNACPSFLFLTLFFATRNYSDFLNSLLTPGSIILTVATIYFLFKFLKVLYGIGQYKKFINFIDPKNCLIVMDGSPGTGKTTSTSEYCVIASDIAWEKIQWNYWLLRNTKAHWKDDYKSRLDYIENKTAFNYWSARPDYWPCLKSNIDNYDMKNKTDSGMTVDGKKVESLTFEMINLEKLMVYGTVIHLEEIGNWAGNKISNKKDDNEGLSEFHRFIRHLGHIAVINDQDKENIYIDIRRPVYINQTLLAQTWVCRPKILIKLHDFIKRRVVKKDYQDNEKIAYFLSRLDKYIKTIGFRKLESEITGNIQRQGSEPKKIKKFNFYIPSMTLAKFDDRYKRVFYKKPRPKKKQERLDPDDV